MDEMNMECALRSIWGNSLICFCDALFLCEYSILIQCTADEGEKMGRICFVADGFVNIEFVVCKYGIFRIDRSIKRNIIKLTYMNYFKGCWNGEILRCECSIF